jgi:two-component system response regulator FixJ
VFVVDDDEPALHSLVTLLKSEGLQPLSFNSAIDLLAMLKGLGDRDEEIRGCVITDVRMPDLDGVELVRALKAAAPALPVIVITGHADVTVAVQAMKAGARDLVEKPYESELILRLVRACLEENDEAVEADARRNRVMRRLESLTSRERQVLDHIVQGASNKVVANQLHISSRTVEIYRANVMAKMRADSLSELVRMTLASGAA